MFLSESDKKKSIFENTIRILKLEAKNGISKNELSRRLADEGICSRMIFYQYFDEMADPNRANILDWRKTKPQQRMCFPTETDDEMEKLTHKIKLIEKLLDFVEKTKNEGDYVVFTSNKKKIPSVEDFNTGKFQNSDKINLDSFEKLVLDKQDINFFNFGARHDLLRSLPTFLINYVNEQRNGFSKQIKQKSFDIMGPLIIRCFEVLQKEYSESLTNRIQKLMPIKQLDSKKIKIRIEWLKDFSHEGVKSDFLKILGRYYFAISLKYSDKLEFDSSKEQKIISDVIRSFFWIVPEDPNVGTREYLLLTQNNGNWNSKKNQDVQALKKMYKKSIILQTFSEEHQFPCLYHASIFANDLLYGSRDADKEIARYYFELLIWLKIINLEKDVINFIINLRCPETYSNAHYFRMIRSRLI